MKIIINADDFGLTEKINDGILWAHTDGILTSTSIVANGTAFEHAISICQSTPSLDSGIHLTLTEEKPLLNEDIVPSLVNKEGRFFQYPMEFTKRYLMGRICFSEVRRELEAQTLKVMSRGISVSHLDGHDHLHMLPKIFTIAVELAKKYGIPAIRFPHEATRISMLKERGWVSRFLQSLVLKWFCLLGRPSDVLRTDYFVGFFFSGNLNKKNLQKVLQLLPPTGTCEVMCHPGLDDPDTRYGHWGYCWSDELSALIDPEIRKFIQRKGIQLISYRQLATS